jgi:hypothetical protein
MLMVHTSGEGKRNRACPMHEIADERQICSQHLH